LINIYNGRLLVSKENGPLLYVAAINPGLHDHGVQLPVQPTSRRRTNAARWEAGAKAKCVILVLAPDAGAPCRGDPAVGIEVRAGEDPVGERLVP
jgi:hypothetical protein